MSEQYDDPFDGLLDLEETFYKEGYDQGVADGKRAGLIEGRFFGLERGFEKYATMGQLYGRAVVWSTRLPPLQTKDEAENDHQVDLSKSDEQLDSGPLQDVTEKNTQQPTDDVSESAVLPMLPGNLRLEKHVRTLYALAEASSLSTENTEDAVANFDDRLKRAEGKMKIIEKLTGETTSTEPRHETAFAVHMTTTKNQKRGQEHSIEDASSLHNEN